MKREKIRRYVFFASCALLVVALVLFILPPIQYRLGAQKVAKQQEALHSLYEDGASSGSSGSSEASSAVLDSGAASPALLAKFHELIDVNPDLIGWLDVSNGALSVPVVQRDNSYYLTHDFYGAQNRYGTVFADYRCKLRPQSDNLILYGHNMGSTTAMFNILSHYRSADYVTQNPIIAFDLLHKEGRYVVFSVFLASTRPEHGEAFDYFNKISFGDTNEKLRFIAELEKRSLVRTDVDVDARDNLLTLSTCTYDFSGARLVVVARQLRDGEAPEDFASISAQANPHALMPDIWNKLYANKN